MKYLEKNNFDDEIKEGLWLVDFFTTWCGPCQMMNPILENLDVNVLKVDVDKFGDLSNKYGIMSVPTLIFFKDGKKIEQLIGFQDEETMEEIIDNLK